MSSSRVSVVIPTHNRGDLLARAISSVLEQNYPVSELIIVDDASDDDTSKVVRSFTSSTIQFVRLNENQGASEARNIGVSIATGDFVCFLDSDDSWSRDHTASVVGLLNEGNDVVIADSNFVSPLGEISAPITYPKDVVSRTVLMRKQGPTQTSCIAVRLRSCSEARPFDARLRSLEDYEFILRQCVAGRSVVRSNQTTVNRFSHPGTHLYNPRHAALATVHICEKYFDHLISTPGAPEVHYRKLVRYLVRSGSVDARRILQAFEERFNIGRFEARVADLAIRMGYPWGDRCEAAWSRWKE